MTFWYFITCYKYSIRNFQKRFYRIVIQTHKNNIFVWCVSLFLKYICNGGVGTAREQTQVSLNFSQHHLNSTFLIHFLESIINSNQLQPMICWLPKGSNNEGWLLLGLEVLFCSIQFQYEYQIFILSLSSGIYTESNWSKQKPYSNVEKCAVIIFDKEKIQKIKLNREDTVFIDF